MQLQMAAICHSSELHFLFFFAIFQAMQYLSDKQEYSKLVDPSLKSYKNDELEVVCEVIRECVNEDPRQRPTMKEITTKLREITKITPEAATSRFSPLWWAELEILSMESS